MRSSTDSELASELVPNTARPQFWLSSHLQCRIQRAASGDRSFLNGVTTGDRTPVIRWLMACSSRAPLQSDGGGPGVKSVDLFGVARELLFDVGAAVEGGRQRRLGLV